MPTPDYSRLSEFCCLSLLLSAGGLRPLHRLPARVNQNARNSGLYLAIFSDLHFFDPDLLVRPGKAFNDYLKKDRNGIIW
ncbi:hypothetical protein [Desulfurispora thermophila]|uniref:hypothetical protein n=1 Tax=Desulfurispora thermophila TaxID=265470 RepID=UPI00036DFF69|nr:hypothetical protein [Desulfurispora thermophila]